MVEETVTVAEFATTAEPWLERAVLLLVGILVGLAYSALSADARSRKKRAAEQNRKAENWMATKVDRTRQLAWNLGERLASHMANSKGQHKQVRLRLKLLEEDVQLAADRLDEQSVRITDETSRIEKELRAEIFKLQNQITN